MKETPSVDASARSPHRKYAGKDASTRQAERRDKLLVAGVDLIGTKGFVATTIDDVCREAGLTKRYFYESFENREALLTTAFEGVTWELLQRIGKAAAAHARDARALVRTGVRETFAFVAEHPAKGQLMMIEAMSVRSQLGRLYVKQFGAFVELVLSLTRSFLPPDTATEAELTVMARGVIGAIIHLCQGWIATDFKQPIDELVAGTVRIFAGIGRELGIPDWMDPAHP
ncbi:TetR/AcrR family transcriptional regulator [Algiphilus sp.]|uniref:TetR/AcrR family transcriptional regulator n=1 Tax=Algiphilus sp. TaxID=1872431 RepID=UPI002A647AE3|nr:TetR/AcrR family transcriptional regulator [Pseudomonadota bacterium]